MTNTRVSQLASLMQGMQSMYSTAEASKSTEAVFGAMLSQTAGNYENQYSWTQQVGKTTVAQSNQAVYEKETAQTSYRDNGIAQKSDTDITSKLPEDAKEQIETAATEVKDVLEDKLEITEEELVQAMEELGISILDLTDSSKVVQLVMELTGSQDGSELLLNQDFQTLLSQVEEVFEQLADGLSLTTEELQQLSVQLSEPQQNAEGELLQQSPVENASVNEESEVYQKTVQTEAQDNVVLTEAGETRETEVQSGMKAENSATDTANQVEEEAQPLVRQTEEAAGENQTDSQTGEDTAGKKESLTSEKELLQGTEKNDQQTQVSFQTTTQTVNNGQTVEVVQTVTQSQIDVESILRQVSQMTRISVTQAESSIEMQLNPENLGKVYLHVVSKEGAITAQLAAQNEAVKEILESQIAILKENMNQQGMKVDAIEVTVAAHEFERNLEGNQQDSPRESEETAKPVRRGINLNNLDELEGLMSEEETLVAQIMRDNGNSVDLTA